MSDTETTTIYPSAQAEAQARQLHQRCEASFRSLVPNLERVVGLPEGRPLRAVRSPFTGIDAFGVPQATLADLDQAIVRARNAGRRWGKAPVATRAQFLYRLHDLLWQHMDEILDVIQWETGKSRYHAYDEIQDIALNCRYYARTLSHAVRDERRRGAFPGVTRTFVMYEPKGVVGVIAPWNYPLSMGITDAIAALAAGNAIVTKPDSNTPLSVVVGKALMVEAGLDPDLFILVPGRGSELGTPLIKQVDYMMFTGSTATGRIIAKQSGENLIGVSAELGGKNPMIVLEDARVDDAVAGLVRSAYANTGQLCVSIERLYVQDSIYDEFKAKLIKRINDMKIAVSFDWEADMGVLVSDHQLETIDTQVQDALSKGAVALAGGHALPEISYTAYAPTLLEGVEEGMTLYDHETFGPVVSLYRFHTDEQAIALANDTNYGLNASVWGKPAHAVAVARRIEAGTVNVNEGFTAAWGSTDAPMGGWKDSGLGRRHGIEGIHKYMESRTIAVQNRAVPIAPVMGLSQEQYVKVLKFALKAMRRLHL